MMLASVIPLARTNTAPLMGFPNLPLPGYNRMTYFLGEQVVWQMFRSVINIHSPGIRRDKHCSDNMLSSISAMFNQDACSGV